MYSRQYNEVCTLRGFVQDTRRNPCRFRKMCSSGEASGERKPPETQGAYAPRSPIQRQEVPVPLVPNLFLFRIAYPCHYHKEMPQEEGDELLDLPEACRLDSFASM